jgi:orotate phosphoribosyltransferase
MLIDDLIECGALRFGDFTLTSGAKSRYYVDIKKASSDPRILSRITNAFIGMGIEAEKVAGVELGAVPLIVAYSLQSGIPFVIIRKGDREHGTKKKIEGEVRQGEKVLLLEDVVTSGGSVINAVDELERIGAKVVHIISVVDREEGGTDKVSARAPFDALVRAKDLLREADRRS